MGISGSIVIFGRLPRPAAPTMAQEHSEQTFAKQNEPILAAPHEVSFGPFRLFPTQFLLLKGDEPVHLGSRALEILIILLERPGDLISRQVLMDRVWPSVFVTPANLTVHISALRRALRDRLALRICSRDQGC